MATGRSVQLTGAIGEFLVSAELCRKGLLATPFSGNVPHYDIIASNEDGCHLVIQVNAINKVNWQFDVSKFVKVTMDGDRQILGNPVSEPYPNLFCVFVALGNDNTKDRYFIFKWKNLADIVINHHSDYLQRHGGMRPKAPKSTHCSISIKQLESYKDRWNLILEALAVKSE
jgi:hypothetical protein